MQTLPDSPARVKQLTPAEVAAERARAATSAASVQALLALDRAIEEALYGDYEDHPSLTVGERNPSLTRKF